MLRPLFLLVFVLAGTGVDVELVRPDAQVAAATVAIDDVPPEFAELENAGLACVALAVYAEARGESWDSQAMVAAVVLNRLAQRTGADPCDVVSEPGQFVHLEAWPFPRRPWAENGPAWSQAIAVARAVMSDDYEVPPRCAAATHFYARSAPPPAWLPPGAIACEINHLVFVELQGAKGGR